MQRIKIYEDSKSRCHMPTLSLKHYEGLPFSRIEGDIVIMHSMMKEIHNLGKMTCLNTVSIKSHFS